MEQSKIKDYSKIVCEQIRWKKAHNIISEEIENHIIDHRNTFISEGLDEETATDRAILEMGDPVQVGSQLDRTHRPKPEWSIILLTGTMLLLGLLIRGFVTYDSQIPDAFVKNIIYTIVGIFIMLGAYLLDYTIIGKYPKLVYVGFLIVAFGTFIFSPRYMGQIFYLKFIIFLFPLVYSGIIYDNKNKGYLGIILSGLYMIIPSVIGWNSGSRSSLALLLITCLVILTYAIVKGWFNIKKLYGLLIVYVPTVIAMLMPYFLGNRYYLLRLKSNLLPYLDPRGSGWMAHNTRMIIANAKLFGQNKYGINTNGLLPDFDTDFILTYLIDKLGWISFVVIMGILMTFIIRSIKLIKKQKNVLGSLVSIAVISTFIIQVVSYTVSNLGFQLIVPLALPLISYGKTATYINMFLIGIMLSVFKSSSLYKNKQIEHITNKKILDYKDGKIIIDLNR